MMFWQTQAPKFVWDESCAKELLSEHIKYISKKANQQVFLSELGLVSSDYIKAQLVNKLRQTEQPFELYSLAAELLLEVKVVEAELELLRKHYSNTVFFGYQILPEPCVRRLQSSLRQAAELQTTKLDFCKQEAVTLQQLDWLLARTESVVALDDVIFLPETVQKRITDLQAAISAAQVPLNLMEFEPVETIRHNAWSDLKKQNLARGLYDRKLGIFTPDSFYESKRKQVLNSLSENSFVKLEDLKDAEINAMNFCEKEATMQVGDYLVKNSKIQDSRSRLESDLKNKGWASLESFGIPKNLVLQAVPEVKKHNIVGPQQNFVISRKFELEVADYALEKTTKTIKSQLAEADSGVQVPSTSDVSSIVQQKFDIPEIVCEAIIQAHMVEIRTKIHSELKAFEEAEKESDRHRKEARAAAYLIGLHDFDESVKWKLYEHWTKYVSEQNLYYNSDFNKSLDYYTKVCSTEAVEAATKGLNQQNLAKLEKSVDSGIALHLAVVLWHSQRILNGKGLLKIRGKLIPDVIRCCQFPVEVINLKEKVAKSKKFSAQEVEEAVIAVKALFDV